MPRQKKQQQTGECTYCGEFGPLTDDHIPPKNIFPKPRDGVITVPACRDCNETAGVDDEYFRPMLILRDDVVNHPAIEQLVETDLRGLQRPEKERTKQAFLESISKVVVTMPDGTREDRGVYNVDKYRLSRVAARIAQGLFFRKFGRRINPEYTAVAFVARTAGEYTEALDAPNVEAGLQRYFETIMRDVPAEKVGPHDIFEYRVHLFEPNEPEKSFWALTFFGAVSFLVVPQLTSEALPKWKKFVFPPPPMPPFEFPGPSRT